MVICSTNSIILSITLQIKLSIITILVYLPFSGYIKAKFIKRYLLLTLINLSHYHVSAHLTEDINAEGIKKDNKQIMLNATKSKQSM